MPLELQRRILDDAVAGKDADLLIKLAFVSGLERLGGPIRDIVNWYSQITDARMRYATLLDAFSDEHIESGGMLKM